MSRASRHDELIALTYGYMYGKPDKFVPIGCLGIFNGVRR